MTDTPQTLPPLRLVAPSSRLGDRPTTSLLDVGGRTAPSLDFRFKNKKRALQAMAFPPRLRAVRVASLPDASLAGLRLPRNTDLLVDLLIPELFGDQPVAQWRLEEDRVLELAKANAGAGALVLRNSDQTPPRPYWILTPYWLDWMGWSGIATLLSEASPLPDRNTLLYTAHELAERRAEPPSGLHLARARLYDAIGNAEEAAAACVDEIRLHLRGDGAPTPGAIEAAVLLGRLLKAYDETNEAWAALAMALWLNPNHRQALLEILPLLEERESVIDALARLTAMPTQPKGLGEEVVATSKRLGIDRGQLERAIATHLKERGQDLWHYRPQWLDDASPTGWLFSLGI